MSAWDAAKKAGATFTGGIEDSFTGDTVDRPEEGRFQYGGTDPNSFARREQQYLRGQGNRAQNRRGAQIDYAQAQRDAALGLQARGGMQDWLNRTEAAYNDPTQTAGYRTMQAGLDQSLRNQMAAARSGPNAAASQRAAMFQGAQQQQMTNQQASILAAQEQAAMRQQALEGYGAMRGMDQNRRGMSAQEAQAQAGLEMQQRALNDQYQLGMEGLGQYGLGSQLQADTAYAGMVQNARTTNAQIDAQRDASLLGLTATLGAGAALFSDIRVKQDIQPMPNIADQLRQRQRDEAADWGRVKSTVEGTEPEASPSAKMGFLQSLMQLSDKRTKAELASAKQTIEGLTARLAEMGGEQSAASAESNAAKRAELRQAERDLAEANLAEGDSRSLDEQLAQTRDEYAALRGLPTRSDQIRAALSESVPRQMMGEPAPGPVRSAREAVAASPALMSSPAGAVVYGAANAADANAWLQPTGEQNPDAFREQYYAPQSSVATVSDERSKQRIKELEGALAAMAGYSGAPKMEGRDWDNVMDSLGDSEPNVPTARFPDVGRSEDANAALRGAISRGDLNRIDAAGAERGAVSQTDLNHMQAAQAVRATKPYSYEYKPEAQAALGQPAGQQYGIMAQDLEKTPVGRTAVVQDPATGTKMVDTARLTTINTAAMGEQQRKIDDLNKKLDALMQKYGAERGQY